MPTIWDGKRCSKGKRNPVALVNTVKMRKIAVPPSNRFAVSNPSSTRKPDAIPIKLISTWTEVKVDNVMPKIMSVSFRSRNSNCVPQKLPPGNTAFAKVTPLGSAVQLLPPDAEGPDRIPLQPKDLTRELSRPLRS